MFSVMLPADFAAIRLAKMFPSRAVSAHSAITPPQRSILPLSPVGTMSSIIVASIEGMSSSIIDATNLMARVTEIYPKKGRMYLKMSFIFASVFLKGENKLQTRIYMIIKLQNNTFLYICQKSVRPETKNG